jgi:hypothetical protein
VLGDKAEGRLAVSPLQRVDAHSRFEQRPRPAIADLIAACAR